MYDNCSHPHSEKGWSVGIRTVESAGGRDARFYFTLRTDRAVRSTTVYGHRRYTANAWTHLMVAYNGHNMSLYVDGAQVRPDFLLLLRSSPVLTDPHLSTCLLTCVSSQVGVSAVQSGNLYSLFMKTCRTFFLGSNQSEQGQSFRGYLGGVVLWGFARSQEDLLQRPVETEKAESVLSMWADFTHVKLFFSNLSLQDANVKQPLNQTLLTHSTVFSIIKQKRMLNRIKKSPRSRILKSMNVCQCVKG